MSSIILSKNCGLMGTSQFILTQLFSCHLAKFSCNYSSCNPNYQAAQAYGALLFDDNVFFVIASL